jgi:hypothetical protein
MALTKAEIVRFNGNAALASFNAIRGVESLRSETAQCEKLPGYDRNMFDKTVCQAKAFAWAAHEAQNYVQKEL